MDEIEDIKKRLSVLEGSSLKSEEKCEPAKKEKKKNDYQLHMSRRLKELKEEAESKGMKFDRTSAFSQAAREWTAMKNKN